MSALNGNRCRCDACGQRFHSVGAFDLHRTGTYQPFTRRCRSIEEMERAGMVLRADGFWTTGRKSGFSPRVPHPGDDRHRAATLGRGAAHGA